MNKQSWLLNLSLLKAHPAFRTVFLACFISIVSLGLLGVAMPVQIQTMTHSTWQVGLSVTPTGGVMFVGLMVGGMPADRYERKKVILLARGTRGIGFIGLYLGALLPEPSLLVIYLPGLWDGSFASLGVTALLTATPVLVGRENLTQARAITMLTVCPGSVISSMTDGLLLATGGVAWSYGLAAAGALIILLPLLNLPALSPPPQPCEYSSKSLLAGFRSLLANPLVDGIALLGGLLAMVSVMWVLYPVLTDNWQVLAAQTDFLYATIPLGVTVNALISGKLAYSARSGLLMLLSMLESFLAAGLSGLMLMWILGVVCLALFGWLSAVSLLLQYTMLQTQTLEAMLERTDSLWTAQNVVGNTIGVALLGGLDTVMMPIASASTNGFGLLVIGVSLLLVLVGLQHFHQMPSQVTVSDS